MPSEAEFDAHSALIADKCFCMACRSKASKGLGGLPSIYQQASWVGQSPIDVSTGRVGVVLQVSEGGIVRLALTPADIDQIAATLQIYRGPCIVQSSKSSDRPSVLGSPQEGR